MLVDTINKLKNISVGYVENNGLFDSATVNAYTASLRGLSATQAEVALSSAGLDKAQKQQILNKLAETNATISLTSAEATEALTRKLGSQDAAKELLIKSGLVTKEQLLAGATIEVTAAELEKAVASSIITAQEKEQIVTALGLTGTNIGLGTSFKLLTASIWASVKAMAAWLFTTPAGWATLAIGAIVGAIAAYVKWGDTLNNTREKLDDLKSEYSELKSELDGVNSELQSVQSRIAELESKGKLTFTEAEELENLQKQNNELKRQNDLLETKAKIKAKETNKTFVKAMEQDAEKIEFASGNTTTKYTRGGYTYDIVVNDSTEKEHSFQQIEKLSELYKEREKAVTEEQKKAIDERIKTIEDYLDGKNEEWLKDAEGIEYIQNPTTDDEKKVNEWLDFINDFQDKMAIAMGGQNAKENAFSRLVDNWKFDELLNPLQKLGKEGKVTAEMLNSPKYGEFIQNLIDIGFIADDTEGSLRFVANAFNGTATSATKYVKALKGNDLEKFVNNLGEEAKALGTTESELAKLTASHIIFNETGLSTEQQRKALELLAAKIATTSAEMKYLLQLFKYASGDFEGAGASTMTPFERQQRKDAAQRFLKNKFGIELPSTSIPEKEIPENPYSPKDDKDSDKNEALDNYLKYAERLYKVHQNEDKYINDLQWAYNNLAKSAEEQLDIEEKINDAIRDRYSNLIKDIEHKIYLEKELYGESGGSGYNEALTNEYQKVIDWGLDSYFEDIKNGTIQSVFGNVDMDKRTIITWSEELKETFRDALTSWDYDPEIGSIDTVFGGSGRFGEDIDGVGWEVAFTPILPDGTFLSKDTVYEYINNILSEAYGNDGQITEEELKGIDEQGRQIGDTFVKGIFAGVDNNLDYDNNGNWAETVGRLMHFSGSFGAIELAQGSDPTSNIISYYDEIQRVASVEANRLRTIGYDDNSNEIQELQKIWWDAQNSKIDFYTKQHENIIRDIEHARDMALEQNPYTDTVSYYKQIQDEYHKQAEYLRALDPEKYKKEIQELQVAWWDAQNAIAEGEWEKSNRWIEDRKTKGDWSLYGDSEYDAWQRVASWLREKYPEELDKIHEADQNAIDARYQNSTDWISERNEYNDWALFDDTEVDAWERVVRWLHEDYPNDISKIKEAEKSLFEARKKEFDDATNFGNTYLESQKTLLQAHYDVMNSIRDAQHEINKELETSQTMYEYLDEDTRKMLFNQEDYNKLTEELNTIQYKALKLKEDYERDLAGSTVETVEKITANYERQYQTLMKSYEIAKADLEIAKKKQQLNNALNERNVRMFIDGQWQWVANAEQVANAKAELADAEYAKQVEEAGLQQKESIDFLTKQQDELALVVKQFEGGVIGLNEAVKLAGSAIRDIPRAMKTMLKNASVDTPGYTSGSTSRSSDGVWYDRGDGVFVSDTSYNDAQADVYNSNDYAAGIESALARGDVDAALAANKIRNDKIDYLGLDVEKWSDEDIKKRANAHAGGSRYTPGGLTLMGEEDFEAYITSSGRLVPISQPTIGNIPSGGVVFNTKQMEGLRTLWDMSNLGLSGNSFIPNVQSQQTNQTYDNRIIINGMTVDSGSADGQALINALKRYVGNH